MPDHPHEHDQVFTNPNEACERYQYISLPLQPAKVKTLRNNHLTPPRVPPKNEQGWAPSELRSQALPSSTTGPIQTAKLQCPLRSPVHYVQKHLDSTIKNVNTDREIFMKIAG